MKIGFIIFILIVVVIIVVRIAKGLLNLFIDQFFNEEENLKRYKSKENPSDPGYIICPQCKNHLTDDRDKREVKYEEVKIPFGDSIFFAYSIWTCHNCEYAFNTSVKEEVVWI